MVLTLNITIEAKMGGLVIKPKQIIPFGQSNEGYRVAADHRPTLSLHYHGMPNTLLNMQTGGCKTSTALRNGPQCFLCGCRFRSSVQT